MDTNRLPKQTLQYKPKGRRHIERLRKRWRDQLHLEDQETGNMPKTSWTWWWWWWFYRMEVYLNQSWIIIKFLTILVQVLRFCLCTLCKYSLIVYYGLIIFISINIMCFIYVLYSLVIIYIYILLWGLIQYCVYCNLMTSCISTLVYHWNTK